jgi:hypothetical protein
MGVGGGGDGMGGAGAVTYRCPRELDYSGESLPLALRGPNFLLCQPELPFSCGGVTELTLAGVARDLCPAQTRIAC